MPNQVTLPVAVVLSFASTFAGGGIAWGAATARANSADANHTKLEKRVEKLEDSFAASRVLLERIDERTARTERAVVGR